MKIDNNCFYPADILLPKNAKMEKFAVVACDQFTSQPEYWEEVKKIAGDEPSALNMILPEVYLEDGDVESRINIINKTMDEYLSEDVFSEYTDSLIYVQRTQSDGKIRHGIVGMVDLEHYDFTPGSDALIRATEGTVLERIPPRVKVRENAALEFPHVMLLIDDPKNTVIGQLEDCDNTIYDFDLMLKGGHIKGCVLNEKQKKGVDEALKALATSDEMFNKYGLENVSPLLFAVGDGNHSLATAKRCYENLKKVTPENEWANLKARYALCEVVNLHDKALEFEPIHRVMFNVDPRNVIEELLKKYEGAYFGEGEGHNIEYAYDGDEGVICIPDPSKELCVATLQDFIDEYIKDKADISVDYIHGDDVTKELGSKEGNIGFLLPPMHKSQLFKTVIADGVLPRKTFSMGHAQDKRYYIEGRKIK